MVPRGLPPERIPALRAVASRCTVHNSIARAPQLDIQVATVREDAA